MRIQLSGNTADDLDHHEVNNNDENLATEKGVSVQEAYEMIGGFGKIKVLIKWLNRQVSLDSIVFAHFGVLLRLIYCGAVGIPDTPTSI